MAKVYQLTFKTDQDKTYTLSIPDANEQLTASTVSGVMTTIINLDFIQSSVGSMVAPEKAALVESTVTELTVS